MLSDPRTSSLEIDIRRARRLALLAAGLLRPDWTGLRPRGAGKGKAAREWAHDLVSHFGYLQLDTVSVAGMRSHPFVLWSRHPRLDPELGEELLKPGAPLFEYWGHEACWIPQDLYPLFQFRRDGFQRSEWWNRIQKAHPGTADEVLQRVREEGPIRSSDLEGQGEGGWWGHKPAKRVVVALWSSGHLAVRERKNFQRTFDLPERIIPDHLRRTSVTRGESLRELLAIALRGHGWARMGTLAQTWRLRNCRPELQTALEELREQGRVLECTLRTDARKRIPGWILSDYVPILDRLARLRPDPTQGRLLSPFDPVLWDRKRVALLFGFEQTLEIFKPRETREFGYFCLPVLAGEELIGRVDPKADRKAGTLRVLSEHLEPSGEHSVLRAAVTDLAEAQGLEARFPPPAGTGARKRAAVGGGTTERGKGHSTRTIRPAALPSADRRRKK